MDKTVEKSKEQASVIFGIAVHAQMLDTEYCKGIANDLILQGDRQDSMMVLNPNHIIEKNDLLRLQGKALSQLCAYVDTLKEIDELKKQIANRQQTQTDIQSFFM